MLLDRGLSPWPGGIPWYLLDTLTRHRFPRKDITYYRSVARALHLDALTLVQRLHLLALCRLAVHLAQQQCPPPLPAHPGGAPRVYSEGSPLLVALLRTLSRPLWRLSYHEAHDWLSASP